FSAIRFLLSFLLLAPFFSFPRERWRDIVVLSGVFGLGHFGLFFFGLSEGINASTASVLMQSGPIFAVVLGVLCFDERVQPMQWLGLALASGGVCVLIGIPDEAPSWSASLLLLGSAAFWAVSVLLMKRLSALHPLQLMCWVCGPSAVLFVILWGIVEQGVLPPGPLSAYAAIVYPALMSTVVAYGMWNYLLRTVPVSVLAPVGLLVPLFGVTGGVVMLDEHFSAWQCAGGAMLLLGVVLCSILPQQRRLRS
ncbi:MAG: DMT family transporter, partial [Bdellovibrionales bacterium]|nr:DMT family transporter [Bdellovibrionales bacterium]